MYLYVLDASQSIHIISSRMIQTLQDLTRNPLLLSYRSFLSYIKVFLEWIYVLLSKHLVSKCVHIQQCPVSEWATFSTLNSLSKKFCRFSGWHTPVILEPGHHPSPHPPTAAYTDYQQMEANFLFTRPNNYTINWMKKLYPLIMAP